MNKLTPSSRRPASYQDVIDAPADKIAEIISGALYLHPRPRPVHSDVIGSLGDELIGPFRKGRGGPGGWRILIEPELHLGQDVLVPDLVGWRRERLPAMPDTPGITVVPDWVCEVLSPSTRRYDLTKKRVSYAGHGVPFLWLIDLAAGTLEAQRLEEGGWTLIVTLQGDVEVRLPPFDAIAFPLSGLWSD